MTRKRMILLVAGTAVLAIGMAIVLASCKGKEDGGLSSTQQAAASSSAAMGAVTLSGTVGGATDIATGAIPANYAPSITGTGGNGTDSIADIDPNLKNAVDRMMGVLKSAGSKASGSSAAGAVGFGSAPVAGLASALSSSASGTCDGGSGQYSIGFNVSSSGSATSWTLSIALTDCKGSDGNVLNGTLTGMDSKDSVASSESASVAVAIAGTAYANQATSPTGTFAMNGSFQSIKTGTTATVMNSTNTANASLSAHDFATNVYLHFTIGDGSGDLASGVQDIVSESSTTTSHTGSGAYSVAISSPSGAVQLSVILAGLNHTVVDKLLSRDEYINGIVNIGWNPDLSQWGCRAGNYQFTTITPLNTPKISLTGCPTSGELTINNADIKYGYPLGVEVTVTVGSLSETFPTCNNMGRGLCN